jgi:hypothetical protein
MHRTLQSQSRLGYSLVVVLFFLWLAAPLALTAAEPAEPAKSSSTPADTIVFVNGDQLTGQFLRSVGDNVTFHSDVVGDVTVPWSKVRELRSSKQFAVISKKAKINRNLDSVPHGSITVADQNIRVHTTADPQPEPVPIKETADVLDTNVYRHEFEEPPNFFHAWNGTLSAGGTVVEATQETRTFNGSASLVRAMPTVPYLPARNKTSFGFSGSYGTITQSGQPEVKTSIFHADAERDVYISSRFYVLAQTAFDHNFSQLLDLQQIYGGGLGWTALNTSRQHLDVKATLQYEKQEFAQATAGTNQDLIGSTFSTAYRLKLPHNLLFNQQVSYIPAYNNPRAYSFTETNNIIVPFYKRLSLSIGTLDTYLNDPPVTTPPSKRNSFQFTTGITYQLR